MADELAWTAGTPPPPGRYAAKTRYRQADAACTLGYDAEGRMTLAFDEPQWAVTPGQSAVIYDGDACLGGGMIASAEAAPAARAPGGGTRAAA